MWCGGEGVTDLLGKSSDENSVSCIKPSPAVEKCF